MKKFCAFILTIIILLSSFTSADAANAEDNISAENYIEAINVNLPQITMYVSGTGNSDNLSVTASLDGEALVFDGSTPYDAAACSTRVYILTDISGSVSQKMFNAVGGCIKKFIGNLTVKQTVKMYTFSQEVSNVLDGSESADEASAKIDNIKVTGNGYTALYDALYLIHEEAVKERDSYDRQMLIVFTDGVDEDNNAQRTFNETKDILKSHDLPVYSMCMDYADSNAKDKLGEISRISGGKNAIFDSADVNSKFSSLIDSAFSCTKLSFSKSNNKAGDKDKNISLSVNGIEYPSVTVYESAVRIKTDNTVPQYTVEYSKEERSLILKFSEQVINADKADSYTITDSSGKAVKIDSVSYDKNDYTARLYFSGRFYSGVYNIDLSGISDDSYEVNIPAATQGLSITAENTAYKIFDYIWLVFIPLCIAIIVILVLLVVKRKRNITTVKELFEVENEQQYEVRHHIVRPDKGREIMLKISVNNSVNEIKTRISSSLIFGRSDACDICIDDVKLSRQHFAFEEAEDGSIWVRDLNSTNGTYLNGGKLASKAALKPGDTISAGLTKLTVNF